MVVSLGVAILVTALGSILMSCSWIVQKTAVVQMPKFRVKGVAAAFRSLIASRTWLLGIALLFGGFGLYQFALVRTGEVSVLQPVTGAGLIFLAVIGVVFLNERLRAGEWVSLLALVAAIVVLGVTAESHKREFSGEALLAFLVVSAALGLIMVLGRRTISRLVPFESLAGAVGGAVQGIGLLLVGAFSHLSKSSGGYLLLSAALVCYTLNLLVIQRGLQEGRAIIVITINTAVINVVAIVGGIVVLGEHLPGSHILAALQVAAFVTIVLGSIPLARLGVAEVESQEVGPSV